MASIFSTQRLTRGTFVKATVAAGGGLILSLSFPRLNAVLAAESNADFTPNAFVRIEPDGKVTFTIPQVEMGQGIYTALSMILAEELDAPFEHVTAVAAPRSHICAAFRRSRIPMRRRPNRRTRSPGMSPERAVIHRASRSMRKPVQAATDGRARVRSPVSRRSRALAHSTIRPASMSRKSSCSEAGAGRAKRAWRCRPSATPIRTPRPRPPPTMSRRASAPWARA
jgi:hypothetical protein